MTTATTTAASKKASKKTKKSTALVTKSDEAIVAQAVPDYGDVDGDDGYDKETEHEYQIPRIIVLQALSPQCLPVSEGGMEGAKAGLLLNTGSGELMESIDFVIAKTEKCFNRWTSRKDGGGFVGRYESNDPEVVRMQKEFPRQPMIYPVEEGKKEGEELIETQYMFLIPVARDETRETLGSFAVLDFTKSKLKSWRDFNGSIQLFTVPQPNNRKRRPPLHAHVVRLSTQFTKNDQGTFYLPKLSPAIIGEDRREDGTKKGKLDCLIGPKHPSFAAAEELAGMIVSGTAKAEVGQDDTAPKKDKEVDQKHF